MTHFFGCNASQTFGCNVQKKLLVLMIDCALKRKRNYVASSHSNRRIE